MDAGTLLMIVVRWAHSLATIVWLGGAAYQLLIQARAVEQLAPDAAAEFNRATGLRFRQWLNGAMVVFIVSGVILTFERLASRGATIQYGIVLGVKVALVLWIFGLAQGLGRRRRTVPQGRFAGIRQQLGSPQALLWLGVIVVLLAAVLKTIYEQALRGS